MPAVEAVEGTGILFQGNGEPQMLLRQGTAHSELGFHKKERVTTDRRREGARTAADPTQRRPRRHSEA